MVRASKTPGVPLEDEFAEWRKTNNVRGKDWRKANIGADGYLINEYGDMVSTKCRNEKFHLLKRQTYKLGYEYYSLCVAWNRSFKIKIHRAVALTFLPNPYNYLYVNHKNGLKNDNRVENLEWITASGNNLHSYRVLGNKSNGGVARKKVQCVETGVIFPSVRAATRFIGPTISNTSVSGAAKGRTVKCKSSTYKLNTCGGYHWRFV